MSEIIRLKLKVGFREPLRLRSEIGFFGRESELSRLKALFGGRTSATVLVSGHRGVGKSALVDEAIHEVQSSGKKPLVARLTLPHVYASQQGTDLREQILRGLARALHFVVADKENKVGKNLKDRAEILYKKTFLKELREENILGSIASSQDKLTTTKGTEIKIAPDRMLSVILGTTSGWTLGVVGVLAAAQVSSRYGLGWGILALIALVSAAVVSGIKINKSMKEVKSSAEALTETNKQTQTGVYDLTPETLEFELRALITDLADGGRPCIFIIDELDKLDTPDLGQAKASLEEHVIFRILSALKNFFTLGSGIYVFIAGEDFYVRLNTAMRDGNYSLAHTLFTDRIFVHILEYGAIEEMIDKLVDEKPRDQLTYRQFKNFLCWESKNHVFDLLGLLEEYVVYENGEPILVAREETEVGGRLLQGNLPADWRLLAGLQKFIGAAYDESVRPTAREQQYNQLLWLILADAVQRLSNGDPIDITDDGYVFPELKWLQALKARDRDDISGAVERLVVKMERYGVVRVTSATVPMSVDGQHAVPEAQVEAARYELLSDPQYPDRSLGRSAERIGIENLFLEVSGRVAPIAKNVKSSGTDTTQFAGDLKQVTDLADKLKRMTAKSTVPRSETRAGLKKANDIAQKLIEVGIDSAIRRWVTDNGLSVTKSLAEVNPRTASPWSDSLSEFVDLVGALERDQLDYYLIGGPSTENQLLVVNNWENDELSDLVEGYRAALSGDKARERRKQRLPIIVINHVVSGEPPNIPDEVVRQFASEESEDEDDFFVFGWWRPPKVTTRREKMAGWNMVSLDTDLSSLGDLPKKMADVSFMKFDEMDQTAG